MFFLLPRVTVILFVCFGAAWAWRSYRQRRRGAGTSTGRRRSGRARDPLAGLPLLPAQVMRGADRTWVVFTTPDCQPCRGLADRLRASEPSSQVTEIDARREPRLAEAFLVERLPAVLLANRYGQVEARLDGWRAVDSALP
ncbi:MAG TPA: thioredoxin family protein [Acidimicrobiales bacterium]|jgi:hypothetical protein|nr:thioredoxin family protein [Acidimicrobiales bacterium]